MPVNNLEANSRVQAMREMAELRLLVENVRQTTVERAVQEGKEARRDVLSTISLMGMIISVVGVILALGTLFGFPLYVKSVVDKSIDLATLNRITQEAENYKNSAKASTVTAQASSDAAKKALDDIIDQKNKLGLGTAYSVACSHQRCLAVDSTGRVYEGHLDSPPPSWDFSETLKGMTAPFALSCEESYRCALVDSTGAVFWRDVRHEAGSNTFAKWSAIAKAK